MNPAPSRLESSAFYVLLATVVLSPLAFWPSVYAPLDLAKALVIAAGTLISATLMAIVAVKERRTSCVPKPIFWTGVLLCLSVVISAFASGHADKSFFGQGFELGTGSFLLILFLSACVAYTLVKREIGRATVLYTGLIASFFILYIFHALRFVFGSSFANLGILNGVTSTVLGGWYALSALALVTALVALVALQVLSLSRRFKLFYWILLILSAFAAFVVNDVRAWTVAALVLLGLSFHASIRKIKKENASGFTGVLSRLAWLPIVACLVAALLAWKGNVIAGPVITNMGAAYVDQPSLSWRGTLDVGSGSMKTNPLFGVGPNRFGQAYLDNKPGDVNLTGAWSLEFASGWSTFSTFVITQGLVGTILWVLLLVFFGIAGIRALKRLPEDPQNRFTIVASLAGAVFLWLMAFVSVLPHVMLFYAFILAGMFLASAVASGSLKSYEIAPLGGSRLYKVAPSVAAFIALVLVVWGLIYAKKTVALAYFAGGVKELTTAPAGDPAKADAYFASAEKWDSSDIYLQGRAEAGIARASALVATLNQQSPASTTQAVTNQTVTILGNALNYADAAIAYDPSNYYNYVSKARVASAAARLQVPKGYETAVDSYMSAIHLNPSNPSLYLTLAQLQASSNKLDDALQSAGAALQVKNNYLDAVFLISQIDAAKGDLPQAITAAQFAAQLNPQSPIIFFQLGLLQYENKNYAAAADAFAAALKLQPDYANAQYFLGLSDVRLGKNADAISEFQALTLSNPGNQEVEFILTNLRAGKSPFADAQPPVATAPEKRSTLPIKQK